MFLRKLSYKKKLSDNKESETKKCVDTLLRVGICGFIV